MPKKKPATTSGPKLSGETEHTGPDAELQTSAVHALLSSQFCWCPARQNDPAVMQSLRQAALIDSRLRQAISGPPGLCVYFADIGPGVMAASISLALELPMLKALDLYTMERRLWDERLHGRAACLHLLHPEFGRTWLIPFGPEVLMQACERMRLEVCVDCPLSDESPTIGGPQ